MAEKDVLQRVLCLSQIPLGVNYLLEGYISFQVFRGTVFFFASSISVGFPENFGSRRKV